MTKPFWKSRTLWFNVVGLAVVMAQYFQTVNWFSPTVLATLLTIGNFVLRLKTDQGVTIK